MQFYNRQHRYSVMAAAVAMTVLVLPACGLRYTRWITGVVFDCMTGQPIPNVKVEARQLGWGYDKGLVWDRD